MMLMLVRCCEDGVVLHDETDQLAHSRPYEVVKVQHEGAVVVA